MRVISINGDYGRMCVNPAEIEFISSTDEHSYTVEMRSGRKLNFGPNSTITLAAFVDAWEAALNDQPGTDTA